MGGSTALIGAAVGALALLAPGDAIARKFQMSGTWAMRRGQLFLPLQFATTAMGSGIQMTHTSQGELSMAFGFPNGPVPGAGGVSATGSAPATLRVPQHRFGGDFSVKLPLGSRLIQLTTMLSPDGPVATATLAPSGGPGSFTWCPGDSACAAGGGMLSTDPPQGAGPHNGRILYRAGAHRFGGVMQMLLSGPIRTSVLFQTSPFQVIHQGGTGLPGIQHTGGPYSFMQSAMVPSGIVTQPLVPPAAGGLITSPGPVVGAIPCDQGTGAPLPCTLIHTGFPLTTGTVFAQQTSGTGGDDFFSVMGSDQRTPLGAGNIALVAGGLSRRANPSGGFPSSYASFGRVRMTLAPPIPTLSPAGLAAAAALVLLGAGYARRRRR